MLDQLGISPDLDLLLSPGDTAQYVGHGAWRCRDGRLQESRLWVALHRKHGLWTHAYRVVRGARPGHVTVFLERAVEGDAVAELRGWVAALLEGARA